MYSILYRTNNTLLGVDRYAFVAKQKQNFQHRESPCTKVIRTQWEYMGIRLVNQRD